MRAMSSTVAWPRPGVFEEVGELFEQLGARSEDLRPELNLRRESQTRKLAS